MQCYYYYYYYIYIYIYVSLSLSIYIYIYTSIASSQLKLRPNCRDISEANAPPLKADHPKQCYSSLQPNLLRYGQPLPRLYHRNHHNYGTTNIDNDYICICVYVCVYIYIYIYIYTHTYVCIYKYVYRCVYMYHNICIIYTCYVIHNIICVYIYIYIYAIVIASIVSALPQLKPMIRCNIP